MHCCVSQDHQPQIRRTILWLIQFRFTVVTELAEIPRGAVDPVELALHQGEAAEEYGQNRPGGRQRDERTPGPAQGKDNGAML